jgi:hypothetical protein
MKSGKKLEIEEQITSMLEQMMTEEFDDISNKTIDTSYEKFDGRKMGKKSMSHQVQKEHGVPNTDICKLDQQFKGVRDKIGRKSNTVTLSNPINTMNNYTSNTFFHPLPFYNRYNRMMLNQLPINNYNTNEMYYNQIVDRDKNNLSDYIYSELERVISINDKIDDILFKSIRANFINIIRTQNGSRIFQKYLKNTSVNIISAIFSELKGNLKTLITDLYANYFCQKFFGFLEKKERVRFLQEVIRFNID